MPACVDYMNRRTMINKQLHDAGIALNGSHMESCPLQVTNSAVRNDRPFRKERLNNAIMASHDCKIQGRHPFLVPGIHVRSSVDQ
jgi:hypothetical protein